VIKTENISENKMQRDKTTRIPWNKGKKGVMPTPWNKGKKMSLEFRTKLSIAHKGQTSPNKGKKFSVEWRENISKSHKGKTAWNKGKPFSTETRKKMSESMKGRNPWNKNTKGLVKAWNKGIRQWANKKHPFSGKTHSEASKKKISKSKKIYTDEESLQRELNRNVKRLAKLGLPFKMTSLEYQYAIHSWSQTVKKLHNNQCQNCYSQAEISHHILHKSKYPALSLNVNNGIALCKKCHNEVHGWKI